MSQMRMVTSWNINSLNLREHSQELNRRCFIVPWDFSLCNRSTASPITMVSAKVFREILNESCTIPHSGWSTSQLLSPPLFAFLAIALLLSFILAFGGFNLRTQFLRTRLRWLTLRLIAGNGRESMVAFTAIINRGSVRFRRGCRTSIRRRCVRRRGRNVSLPKRRVNRSG